MTRTLSAVALVLSVLALIVAVWTRASVLDPANDVARQVSVAVRDLQGGAKASVEFAVRDREAQVCERWAPAVESILRGHGIAVPKQQSPPRTLDELLEPLLQLLQSESSAAAVDAQVLDVVLSDLITYTGDDSPLRTSLNASTTLDCVPAQALGSGGTLNWRPTPNLPKGEWERLTEREQQLALQSAMSADSRAHSTSSLLHYRPANPRIVMHDGVSASNRSPSPPEILLRRAVSVFPPGLSEDGTAATVHISIPWGNHGGLATYVLLRDGDAWSVRLREFRNGL